MNFKLKSTNNDDIAQDFPLGSLEGIIDLLKATAHDTRLQILVYLSNSEKSLPYLHEHIKAKFASKGKVSKTALAHHLNQLIDTGLIEKTARGMYSLTEYGSVYIKQMRTVLETYSVRNQILSEPEKQKEFTHVSDYLKASSETSENMVSVNPLYQSGWNSYISSVSGVLESLGVNDDYIQLSGHSAYCFIFKVSIGAISFLGEGILSDKAWEEIYKGTESFGWKINEWKSERVYPHMWNLTGEDFETAKEMFYRIRFIIDEYDTPVVLWGLRVPNFGIVKGYDDDSYIVSTYYRKEALKDTPVRYDSIYAHGSFKFLYFTKSADIKSVEEEDKISILRAINMAKGVNVTPENTILGYKYISGPKAYNEFADILLNFDTTIPDIATGFHGRYYQDAKAVATDYLERLARKYASLPQGELLLNASKQYRVIKNIFEEFMVLFPYYNIKSNKSKKGMTEEKRKKGADLLLKAKDYEESGIKYLEQAAKQWKSSSR